MALAFDAASSSATVETADASLTWSHTCSGSDRLLLVAIELNNPSSQTIGTVTYNGDSMTLVDSQNNGTASRVELWKLVNPDTGGAFNIVATVASSGTARMVGGALSFNGADQTTPLSSTVKHASSNTPISNSISSAATEIVCSFVAASAGGGSSLTNDGGQTQRWNTFADNALGVPVVRGGGATKTGSATTTMTWTCAASQTWAHMMVAVKPVAAAAAFDGTQVIVC